MTPLEHGLHLNNLSTSTVPTHLDYLTSWNTTCQLLALQECLYYGLHLLDAPLWFLVDSCGIKACDVPNHGKL